MKKKLLMGGIIAVVILGACGGYYSIYSALPVESEKIKLGKVRETVSETGTLEAGDSAVISANNGGEVLALHVKEGDAVKKGDQLITVKESGDDLKAENSRNEEINSMKSQLSGLEKQRTVAADQMSKYKKLLDEGAVSYDVYAQYELAKSKLDAEVGALQHSIRSLQAFSGKSSAADAATIEGVITKVYVKPGETITLGGPIAEISDMKEFFIKVDLIVGDANKVAEGNRVLAYNKDYDFSDENGMVDKIAWKAEEKLSELGVMQKRVAVEIKLSKDPGLKIGSDINLDIITAEKDDVALLPEKAIFQKNDKDVVFLIKDGRAAIKPVKIGLKGEDYFECLSGLKAGDEVILSPAKELDDGVKVKKENL